MTHHPFSFTCCDIEPAVLARNVVLYTLIIDELTEDNRNVSPHLTLWNLFYHFYITKQDLAVLRRHMTKLLNVAGSYKVWTSSSYGEFIKYVDQATLFHLRKYWVQYAATEEEDHVRARNARARSAIEKRSRELEKSGIVNSARAAGPLLATALEVMADTCKNFWISGVAGSNPEDLAHLERNEGGFFNPLFAVSSAPSQDFAVHYGADPLANFHIAEAFYRHSSGKATEARAEEIVAVAKAQFREWCRSFRCFVHERNIVVRCFFGDALAFGHALQLRSSESEAKENTSRSYRKAWSSEPLLIDGDSPEQYFDVIDTSNLGDHVGLINMLSATAPLLKRGAPTVLYTESLLRAAEDIATSLDILLGSDVTTFSILVGLSPAGLLSNVTMDAVGNEAALFAIMPGDGKLGQYRMRLAWKPIESGDLVIHPNNHTIVGFESKTLAAYLFSIYKKMFANEDPTQMMERMQRLHKVQYSVDLARYTRAGMAALLRLVKTRISVDWNAFMLAFLELIESDRTLIVGSNSLQELYMHLHLFGVWTTDALSKSPRQLGKDNLLYLRPKAADTGLLGREELPSIVHLVLIVPRKKLEVFQQRHLEDVGTPALHVSIAQAYGSSPFENSFFSFQCFFGNIKYEDRTSEITDVREDENGWRGTKDLIVITALPTFGLLMGPIDGLTVALKINTNIETVMRYSSLGPLLKLYETSLKDSKRCFVCRHAPGLSTVGSQCSQEWIQAANTACHIPSHSLVKLDQTYKATHIQNHIDFPKDSAEGTALAKGATVAIEHTFPSTITASIGTAVRHHITFPFPVIGSKAKTRIARKSSWIEVEAQVTSARDVDPFESWTQVVINAGGTPECTHIPRIDLLVQPRIPLSKRVDMTWIRTFLSTTLSDTECAINAAAKDSPTSRSARIDFKQSINALFSSFAGLNDSLDKRKPGRQCPTFQLLINNSCHTIIFVVALHHDLDLDSIALEAFVLPLTIPKVMALARPLCQLQEATSYCNIHVTPAETVLWKRLLPALAERCRTYPHTSTCEYRRPGAKIPLSVKEAENPLCSCGEGQFSASEFVKRGSGERAWAPFAKYVTRIAISPIFPVPFLENSMSTLRKLEKTPFRARGAATAPMSSLSGRDYGEEGNAKCDYCGKASGAAGVALKTCAGCGNARYCGAACQKGAWRVHKRDCKRT